MQRGRWRWVIIAATFFATRNANALPLRLTIDEAVAHAIAANPDLGATRKDLDVAHANLDRSAAWLPGNPYFSTGAQHTSQLGFGANYVLSLFQEFEIGGQRGKRMAVAREGMEKTAEDIKNAERDLAANVKTVFVQSLASVDRVVVAQQSVDAAAELANQLGRHTRLSDADRVSLNVARIQETRTRRDLAAAEQTRDNAFGTLRLLLGVPLDQELELAGVLTSEEKALPPGPELVERALHQRSDLVAVQRAVQRAALQIGLTKREAIPNITLSGSLSRFEGDTLLGGDIAFPIPIFRRRTSDIDEALAERERATLLLQNLERDVAKQVQEARRACGVAAGNLEAQRRDIVPKSEENLDLERRLYERGEASLLEVIGAQIDLFSARRDYLDALEAYNISLIELERAIGGNLDGR